MRAEMEILSKLYNSVLFIARDWRGERKEWEGKMRGVKRVK